MRRICFCWLMFFSIFIKERNKPSVWKLGITCVNWLITKKIWTFLPCLNEDIKVWAKFYLLTLPLTDSWNINLTSVRELNSNTRVDSLACDGNFLFVHVFEKGLLKVGTGYGDTIKGHVYSRYQTFYSVTFNNCCLEIHSSIKEISTNPWGVLIINSIIWRHAQVLSQIPKTK